MTHRIHIVDGDEAVRHSLAFLLSANGYGVQGFKNGAHLLQDSSLAEASCVIADLHLPDMTGTELIPALRSQGQTVPVIIVSGHCDVSVAVEAIKAGACNFLARPFSDDFVLAAVTEACVSPVAGLTAAKPLRRLPDGLTRREQDVLEGLFDGLSNKLIGDRLGISPRTIEIHRANLMSKFRAKTLPLLIKKVLEAEGSS